MSTDTRTAERSSTMRAVGIVATATAGIVVAAAAAIGVRSIPDVKRYLEMRRM